jgi:hypothetical protein
MQGFFLAKGNIAICKGKCKEMKLARKLQGNCKNIRNIFKKTQNSSNFDISMPSYV